MASEKVLLTSSDLEQIDAIIPLNSVSGNRYADRFMNALNK